MLKDIARKIRRVLKVDDQTANLNKARYARVCVEIDLSVPFKREFCLGENGDKFFINILYQQLPTFCYRCGLIGHGDANCN